MNSYTATDLTQVNTTKSQGQGRLSPNNHGAIPPFSRPTPPRSFSCHLPPPRKQFLDIVYAILCNFMRVFSEFWKLSVTDNHPKNERL